TGLNLPAVTCHFFVPASFALHGDPIGTQAWLKPREPFTLAQVFETHSPFVPLYPARTNLTRLHALAKRFFSALPVRRSEAQRPGDAGEIARLGVEHQA